MGRALRSPLTATYGRWTLRLERQLQTTACRRFPCNLEGPLLGKSDLGRGWDDVRHAACLRLNLYLGDDPSSMESAQEFATLLERSEAFTEHLASLLQRVPGLRDDARGLAGRRAAHLALEHGAAVRILFAAGAPNAACALLRSQYEAALRGAWAVYAASNEKVDKLNRPLDPDSEQAAKNLDGLERMLDALKSRAGLNPQLMGLVIPLDQIREKQWKAMNSFVHGGIHPLQRIDAFPVGLAAQVVRNSNGISHIACRLLMRLTTHLDSASAAEIERAYVEFEDCVPMTQPVT